MMRTTFILLFFILSSTAQAAQFNQNYEAPTFDSVATLTKSADYPITTTDNYNTIEVTASTVDITLTLPTISTLLGVHSYKIKKMDATPYLIIVTRSGTDTIDKATAYALANQNDVLIVEADGRSSNWTVLFADSVVDVNVATGAVTIGGALALNGDWSITGTTPTLTIGDGGEEDTGIVWNGNAFDFYASLDDSADDLVIGLGSVVGTTPILALDENRNAVLYRDLTIGDAAAADRKILFDGNAVDFHVGLDDSSDDLVIGIGSALGTDHRLSIDESTTSTVIIFGDGAEENAQIRIDGNAVDFHMGLEDASDSFVIGTGSVVGSNAAVTIDSNRNVQITSSVQLVIPNGAAPGATCIVGSIFLDTNETNDTNCTTTADNSLCLCTATNVWTALENN